MQFKGDDACQKSDRFVFAERRSSKSVTEVVIKVHDAWARPRLRCARMQASKEKSAQNPTATAEVFVGLSSKDPSLNLVRAGQRNCNAALDLVKQHYCGKEEEARGQKLSAVDPPCRLFLIKAHQEEAAMLLLLYFRSQEDADAAVLQ